MDRTTRTIEQGGSEGCTNAGAVSNMGLSSIIDSAAQIATTKHKYIYDDGYAFRTKEEMLEYCEYIQKEGPKVGYNENQEPTVHNLYLIIWMHLNDLIARHLQNTPGLH